MFPSSPCGFHSRFGYSWLSLWSLVKVTWLQLLLDIKKKSIVICLGWANEDGTWLRQKAHCLSRDLENSFLPSSLWEHNLFVKEPREL